MRSRRMMSILLVSLILRWSVSLWMGNQVKALPGIADQISYHMLALRLLQGYGFSFPRPWWPMTAANAPTAHWSFLYTFYLAGVYALLRPWPVVARLIQATVTGILHPWLTAQLGKQLFDSRVGELAAAITALYAYFIYYSAALMTEAFYITAILGGLLLVVRVLKGFGSNNGSQMRRYLLSLGTVLGIAVLLRQVMLLVVPFLVLWLAWALMRRSPKGKKRNIFTQSILLILFPIILCILPFTLYNLIRFHRFVLLNTNAGYAFFWANHPIYGSHFIPILPSEGPSYQDLIPPPLRGLDEAALDHALLKKGLQFVLADPVRYFKLSLSRVPVYFKFWPEETSSTISNLARIASFGLTFPWMLTGVYLALKAGQLHPKAEAFPLILFTTVYTAIHLLSWALIRYRLPVDAVLVLFAAFAIVQARTKLHTKPCIFSSLSPTHPT